VPEQTDVSIIFIKLDDTLRCYVPGNCREQSEAAAATSTADCCLMQHAFRVTHISLNWCQ